MEVDKLYIVNRGNQNQSVGLIIKGGTSSVQVFGTQLLQYGRIWTNA